MRKANNGADQHEQECDLRIHRSASLKSPLEGGAECVAKSIPKLKNTIAEAIMTVLSRNSKFARNTLAKMAPLTSTSPFGAYYSHIRIEFVVRNSEPTDDFFTLAGEDVPGETWVFGICGNRRERGTNDPGLKYYYYSGILDNCPVADIENNVLITNDAFRTTLRNIRGSSWDVGADEWHERVHEMLPKHVIHQLVEFQKAGAGDYSADLYNVTVRRDPKTKKEIESFEEAFFRKMVAPELLAGAMGDEAEDNEWFFEETIEASLRKLVDASRKTRNRLKELQDARAALDEMEPVKVSAREADEAVTDFRDTTRKIAQEVVLLTDLVDRDPLPGIPHAAQSTDIAPTAPASWPMLTWAGPWMSPRPCRWSNFSS